MELVNEFSVSKTKIDNFNTCLRKYYFRHYGHWNGWRKDAPPLSRELYALSKLSSRSMWVGTVVHQFIDQIIASIRSEKPIAAAQAPGILRRQMQQQWDASRSAMTSGDFARRPKQVAETTACLLEHFYGMNDLTRQEDFEADFEHASRCVLNFYGTSIYHDLIQHHSVEYIHIPDFSSTIISGIKTFVQIDFAYRLSDEETKIVDWKTGLNTKRQGVLNQLLVYAVYAMQELNIPAMAIVLCGIDLFNGEEYIMSIDPYWLDAVSRSIVATAHELRKYLIDPVNNVAAIESFPMVQDSSACFRCPFKKPCNRL